MPEPGTEIEFTNWKYGTWAPFVIYADLESVLAPNDQQRGATHLYQKHKPCAASALLCSKIRAFDGRFCLFTGEDVSNNCSTNSSSGSVNVSTISNRTMRWFHSAVESWSSTLTQQSAAFVTVPTVHSSTVTQTTAKSPTTIT